MRQTLVVCATLLGLSLTTNLLAQQARSSARSSGTSGMVTTFLGTEPMNQDDPGYELYKEGYNSILTEDWERAQVVLDELIVRYPKSDYVDDACYWSAYALRHVSREKAAKLYRRFIEEYRHSSYYDDAVADLTELESVVLVRTPEGPTISISKGDVKAHTYIVAPSIKKLEREFRHAARAYSRIGIRKGAHDIPAIVRIEEDLDPETRLKMEALYALGDADEDEHSFTMLKGVALDMEQPEPLREAAMESLAGFEQFDVVTVFVDIAKNDTSPSVQSYAIDYIGKVGKDDDRKVTILVHLFDTLPDGRTDQRETVFYTIADIGNDRAVDFLTTVAMSHGEFEFRRDAVYYLGSIGGTRARNALLQILSNK